ncbi:hypothetical protein FACS1894110_25660 [Spirochaetia bacterium]|nr:hypothetical protein FACS1894110_25660 [Spirochaetia bacterium]
MIKRKLSKEIIIKQEYEIWNAFIDILATEDEKYFTDIQKNAQRAFRYDSEIQNGGHLQYFENNRLDNYSHIIKSIEMIGAINHAKTLEKAVGRYFSKKRKVIKIIKNYVLKALEEEYADLDSEYGLLVPDMNYYLEKYLEKYQDEFIEIV